MAAQFPPPDTARPDGLLCVGGDLSPLRLIAAYCQGIFPWYSSRTPILWWSPDPRCILMPHDFHLSRTTRAVFRKKPFCLSMNKAFAEVIHSCSRAAGSSKDVWLLPEMIEAYKRLNQMGYAHSFEAWRDGKLVGGLYGVSLGRAFFGESMFHVEDEASRAALLGLIIFLRQKGALLLDCQQETPHMLKMGAISVPRSKFLLLLKQALSPKKGCSTRTNALPWAPDRKNYAFYPALSSWLPSSKYPQTENGKG